MSNININGSVDYWYQGEGSTDIGQTSELVNQQEFWYMGAPAGYFVGVSEEIQPDHLNSFAVLIGF